MPILEEQYEKARKVAYKYLSGRSRTEWQTVDMLFRKGFDRDTINLVIGNLREYGLLNDGDFADWYVSKRPLHSRAMLAGGLRNLGVGESIIDRVLAGIDSEAELVAAMSLASGKMKSSNHDYYPANIAAFLRRKGFSGEIVERVCNCLENMRHP